MGLVIAMGCVEVEVVTFGLGYLRAGYGRTSQRPVFPFVSQEP